MNMEGLKANRLTEEEMSDVAGGGDQWYTYIVKEDCTVYKIISLTNAANVSLLKMWNKDRYPDIVDGWVCEGWELKYKR